MHITSTALASTTYAGKQQITSSTTGAIKAKRQSNKPKE